MYQKLLTGVVLAICSYTDLKARKIYTQVLAVYFVLILAGHIFSGHWFWQQWAAGGVFGCICFLMSWLSKERLGYGDSILITLCGVSEGAGLCLWICLTAFFWAGVWSLILLAKKKQIKEMPFVPFLFFGFLVQSFGGLSI